MKFTVLLAILSAFCATTAHAIDLPDVPTPYALLQVQGVALAEQGAAGSRGDRAELRDFTMRRMRVGVRGVLGTSWRYHIMTDLARSDMLYEAWVRWEPSKYFAVTTGNYMVQFGRSQIFYPGEASLPEFAYGSRAMTPFRQSGVQLSGALPGGLRWWAGAFSAPQRAGTFWQGYREDAGTGTAKIDGLGTAVRVQYEPFAPVGDLSPHDLAGGPLRLLVAADYMHLDGTQFHTDAWSASIHAKAYGAHLLGEVIHDIALTERQAVYGELGYTLNSYVIAARYEFIQPNTADKALNEQVYSAALGMSANKYVRLRAQWDRRITSTFQYSVGFGLISLCL